MKYGEWGVTGTHTVKTAGIFCLIDSASPNGQAFYALSTLVVFERVLVFAQVNSWKHSRIAGEGGCFSCPADGTVYMMVLIVFNPLHPLFVDV